MGYLEKVFQSAYISEEVPSDKIILLPKDIKDGIEYNLLLSKNDFDSAVAMVRRTEPMTEPILIGLVSKNEDTRLNSYKALLSSRDLLQIYHSKEMQYLEHSLREKEQSVVKTNNELSIISAGDMMKMASDFCEQNPNDSLSRAEGINVNVEADAEFDDMTDPFGDTTQETPQSLGSIDDLMTSMSSEPEQDLPNNEDGNESEIVEAYSNAIAKFEDDMRNIPVESLNEFYTRLSTYISDKKCLPSMASVIEKAITESHDSNIVRLLLSNAVDPNVNGNDVFCETLVIVCKYLISIKRFDEIETLFSPISDVMYGG